MNENVFLDKLAGILQVDRSLLNQPEFQLDAGVWDSFAVMETIALIDEHYQVTVPAVELSNCKTADALLIMISQHKQLG